MAQVRELPEDRPIYTNGVDAIYILAGRQTRRLPAKYSPHSLREYADYDARLKEMLADLRQNRGRIVYFDNVTARPFLPDRQELQAALPLTPVRQLSDGTVYAAAP
jgi:hypothetical protein